MYSGSDHPLENREKKKENEVGFIFFVAFVFVLRYWGLNSEPSP
jgi:hypothetical protein